MFQAAVKYTNVVVLVERQEKCLADERKQYSRDILVIFTFNVLLHKTNLLRTRFVSQGW